jgi:hypothetical protein
MSLVVIVDSTASQVDWVASRDYSKEILSLHKSAKNDQIYINLATF